MRSAPPSASAGAKYEVVLRLIDPQSQAEVAPVRGLASIDVEELALQTNPDEYGRMLAAQVFADAAVRGLYQRARAALERAGLLLRVRIAIEPTASELHDLRWELLRDPETDASMATSERIVLSRCPGGGGRGGARAPATWISLQPALPPAPASESIETPMGPQPLPEVVPTYARSNRVLHGARDTDRSENWR